MKAILHSDGGARGNPGETAGAALLFDENYNLLNFAGKYVAHATNNYAEYLGLEIGLKMAVKTGVTDLTCKLDSELVVKQLNGEFKIKNENIRKFYSKINSMLKNFNSVEFVYIPRAENHLADKLVNLILDIEK